MQPVCQQCLAVSLTTLRLGAPSMLEGMSGRCGKLAISLIAFVILLGHLHIHYSNLLSWLLPLYGMFISPLESKQF
jgi:hypothetical protein